MKDGVAFTKDDIKEMEKVHHATGLLVSVQIELRLKGWKVEKVDEGIQASMARILRDC